MERVVNSADTDDGPAPARRVPECTLVLHCVASASLVCGLGGTKSPLVLRHRGRYSRTPCAMPPVHSAAEGEALWRRVVRAVGAAVDAGLCRHMSARWSLDWQERAVRAVTPEDVQLPGGVVTLADPERDPATQRRGRLCA